MMPSRPVATTLLLATVLCSCAATIERRGAPTIDAPIVGSDLNTINVKSKDGSVATIDGREIIEIDHPGNVLMTVGLGYAGWTLFKIVILSAMKGKEDAIINAVEYDMSIGLGLAIAGAIPYFLSLSAAQAFDPTRVQRPALEPVQPIPTATDDEDRPDPVELQPPAANLDSPAAPEPAASTEEP